MQNKKKRKKDQITFVNGTESKSVWNSCTTVTCFIYNISYLFNDLLSAAGQPKPIYFTENMIDSHIQPLALVMQMVQLSCHLQTMSQREQYIVSFICRLMITLRKYTDIRFGLALSS